MYKLQLCNGRRLKATRMLLQSYDMTCLLLPYMATGCHQEPFQLVQLDMNHKNIIIVCY